MTTIMVWVGIGMAALLGFILFIYFLRYFPIWIQATSSGAHISFFSLIGMGFRKVNAAVIVRACVMAKNAGLPLGSADFEGHYLQGGDVERVINALIEANKANIPLDFKKACAIDLAGRDVLDAVNTSVLPKVIDCPSGGGTISAVAKDGIEIKVRARVTVRTNIERLVGGATEETIIARVGEGIVTSVGSSDSYKVVLENPDHISKTVLAKGLDAQTSFEILSIDIADVDVGDNIGARLRVDQAEAQKRMAQAEAEQRRAMAVAHEQEMKATTQENRAKVVLAEAEVPMALAAALRSGNLGVMDYYRMKNIQADTGMRDSLGGAPPPSAGS